jgi:hypothetical protein
MSKGMPFPYKITLFIDDLCRFESGIFVLFGILHGLTVIVFLIFRKVL